MELTADTRDIKEKLRILSDAAKYDAACTSSGVDRPGKPGDLGNSIAAGICHSFASDGRCISLLKILLTNHCIFDCKYCINRRSNDIERAAFTPDEVCTLTIEFYRRNYIEGLFLSSGVMRSPNDTMEKMYETLYKLREVYRFRGYIHVKAIPGVDPALLDAVGLLADRMSINLELPTAESLHTLAPHKNRKSILGPMRRIQTGIVDSRLSMGQSARLERAYGAKNFSRGIFGEGSEGAAEAVGAEENQFTSLFGEEKREGRIGGGAVPGNTGAGAGRPEAGGGFPALGNSGPESFDGNGFMTDGGSGFSAGGGSGLAASDGGGFSAPGPGGILLPDRGLRSPRTYVPAGQSTQIIVGATPETDYHMMMVTQALYQNYDLKRVFFSAYVGLNEDSALPAPGGKPPLLREHRLYQADWLLRFYGFQVEELLSEERPNFNVFLDPKCDWAVRHLEYFPVEIMKASYELLLRVPGIGAKSARRIVQARRIGRLDFPDLKRLGVVLKRARYFILCSGRQMYPVRLEENLITSGLISDSQKKNWKLEHRECYRQMNLFDDMKLEIPPSVEDFGKAAAGQM